MLIPNLVDVQAPSLGLSVDPIAALRFVQAEFLTQVANSLASRASRLEHHLDKLVRAFQLDETMREMAGGTAAELPPFTLFNPLSASNLNTLDQFVDRDPLVLGSTRAEAEELATVMTDLGIEPPPVMTPVLGWVAHVTYSKTGAVISQSTDSAFNWVSTQQRVAATGTTTDLGSGVIRMFSTSSVTVDGVRTDTASMQYFMDRKANRRFTEAQFLAARGQVSVAQFNMLPELQRSAAVIGTQTALLHALILQQDRTRGAIVKREDRLEQEVVADDYESKMKNEQQRDLHLRDDSLMLVQQASLRAADSG